MIFENKTLNVYHKFCGISLNVYGYLKYIYMYIRLNLNQKSGYTIILYCDEKLRRDVGLPRAKEEKLKKYISGRSIVGFEITYFV